MKKIVLILILIATISLTGCDRPEDEMNTPNQVLFDNMVFDYVEESDDFYIYDSNGVSLEMKMTNETMFVSYEKREDIYFIEGTSDSFTIRKNGSLIMSCTGEIMVCTGSETIAFYEEVPTLYLMVYTEE